MIKKIYIIIFANIEEFFKTSDNLISSICQQLFGTYETDQLLYFPLAKYYFFILYIYSLLLILISIPQILKKIKLKLLAINSYIILKKRYKRKKNKKLKNNLEGKKRYSNKLMWMIKRNRFNIKINFRTKSLILLYSISIFTFSIGFISGSSINPITYVLIPSILSIFGGVITYLTSASKLKNYWNISLIIIVFTTSIVYGLYHGTIYRDEYLDINNISKKEALLGEK